MIKLFLAIFISLFNQSNPIKGDLRAQIQSEMSPSPTHQVSPSAPSFTPPPEKISAYNNHSDKVINSVSERAVEKSPALDPYPTLTPAPTPTPKPIVFPIDPTPTPVPDVTIIIHPPLCPSFPPQDNRIKDTKNIYCLDGQI